MATAKISIKGWIIFVFFFALFLMQNMVYYQEHNMPYGKNDHINYIGLFIGNMRESGNMDYFLNLLRVQSVKISELNNYTIHYAYVRGVRFIADLFGLDPFIVVCALIPLLSFIMFPLALNTFLSADKVYLIIFGSYFIWAGLSIGLMAQFVSMFFYWLGETPKFRLFRYVSFIFHPYAILYFMISVFYKRLNNKNYFYIVLLLFLVYPNLSFLNGRLMHEPTVYMRFFTILFPLIVPALFLGNKNIPFLLVLMAGTNTRLLMFAIPDLIRDYEIPKNNWFWLMVIVYFVNVWSVQNFEIWSLYNDPCHPSYLYGGECDVCHVLYENCLK